MYDKDFFQNVEITYMKEVGDGLHFIKIKDKELQIRYM